MKPNYLKYDRAVYFPKGLSLDLDAAISGPGYEVRRDCVILRAGTEAPHPKRPSHLPVYVHGTLYHAIASGRLPRSWRWRADGLFLALMKQAGCGICHRTMAWLYMLAWGGVILYRQRQVILATGSVVRKQ